LPDGVTIKMIGLGGIAVSDHRLRKLRPEVVDELAQSIALQGLLQPIRLRPRSRAGGGYILVAGWHRLEAVRKLGANSIRAEIVDDMKADATLLAEIDENLVRAELTPAERAMHIGERKKLYEKMYPETKHGGAPGKAGGGKKAKDAKIASFVEQTSKATSQSKRKVHLDATRAKHVVVLSDVAGTSLDKGDELDALAKLSEDEQHKLAKRVNAGEKVSAKTRVKQVRRAEREEQLALSTAAAATALGQEIPASVILVDWALRFEVRSELGEDRSPENHYPCGTVEEMAALKPPMADDVVVFAWTSAPQLENSMTVMRSWGLQYKSYWGWDKEIEGTGYWGRSRLELILIGTKGDKIPAPAPGEQCPQLFRSRRREHSRKPDEVYEAIERLYPNLVKLEMFARNPRTGWRSWGNELPNRTLDFMKMLPAA
jgi:N6-adenosine-specific RNA methylase IME4